MKKKVCEEGGLSGMLHAMRMYPDDAELCECVCRAVSSLAGCSKAEMYFLGTMTSTNEVVDR